MGLTSTCGVIMAGATGGLYPPASTGVDIPKGTGTLRQSPGLAETLADYLIRTLPSQGTQIITSYQLTAVPL